MCVVEESHRQIILVRLTPNASRNEIGSWDYNEQNQPVLKVSVTAIPEKGKANQALIKLLSKQWKIPKSSIQIEKGETDRNKILSVPKNTIDSPDKNQITPR
ncbi:MAG: DUF167 domain-containing protein [Alphaproteobacteria bacterium]|nr:DUF167 domain-containing protein [Alphaproteobacteria bacterium]